MSNRGSACPPGWRLPESQHAILRSPRIRVGCPDLLFSEEREMPHGIRCLVWCWAVVACAVFAGCSDPDRAPTAGDGAGGTGTTGTSKGTGSAASADGKGVDSGSKPNGDKAGSAEESGADLSAAEEKFVVPSREDVEARANWFDQPVANLLDRRKEQEKGTPPEASAALALRNNTRQTNEQIVATLGRVAQSDDDVDYNATLNKHIKADARSTNPLLQSSVYEVDVQGLIGLLPFTFDRDLNRVGDADVIVSWQTSSDRMMDKVVLRDDLVWSDGHPVTAHDLEFAFQTVMNPKIKVPAIKTSLGRLHAVKAYDDWTVVFFHKEALATNPWNISVPFFPKHIYEKTLAEDPTMEESEAHVELEKNPVVCGPYRLVDRQLGSQYLFERREDWFMHKGKQVRNKPYFKQVRIRVISDLNTALLAVKKGEIDEMELSAEQWVTQTGDDDFYDLNTKASGVEWTTYLFTWNTKTPYFSDVRVRKAMGLAFNHKELHETLNYGLFDAANGVFHPASWMAPKPGPAPYQQDLDMAEKLLDEAGWVDSDGDGIRDKKIDGKLVKFEFNIICTAVAERIQLCTLLKNCLEQIGVVCNVSPLDFAVLQERTIDHNFHAAFGGWGAGADPDLSFNVYGTDEGRNYGSYSNLEVDKLFMEARHEFDRAKRAKLYARVHELIYADQPATYLFYKNSFYAFSKKLRGYQFSPRGPYHYGPGVLSLYKVRN